MGPHRGALPVDVVAHVDGSGDDLRRGSEVGHLGRVGRVGDVGYLVRPVGEQALDEVAVRRRLVHAPGAGQFRRSHSDPVHLHVVGMAVAAVVVVDGQDVGVLLPEDGGQARGGLVEIGARERSREVVRGLALHTGIVVAEELDPVDAQHLGRVQLLGNPALAQCLARRERVGRVFAQLAAAWPRPGPPGDLPPSRAPSCLRS